MPASAHRRVARTARPLETAVAARRRAGPRRSRTVTITLKLPEALHDGLVAAAREARESKSALVRSAIQQALHGRVAAEGPSAFYLEKAARFAGCAVGPERVSTKDAALDGLGAWKR